MEERYKACFLLHALGDTIGFKNGEWEFNFFRTKGLTCDDTLELLYDFIALGGINHLSIKGWKVSDDTILHVAIGKSLLKESTNINKLGPIIKQEFIESIKDMEDRYLGETLYKNITLLKEGFKWDSIPYNKFQGGSGAAMRSSCIGLVYFGKQNRDKLIEIVIESSRITHNSAVGYLGALTTALFTAYAIENIPLEKWAFKLIELLESGKIEEYLKKTRGLKEYVKDKDQFIHKWKIYIDDKFDDNKNVIKRKSFNNLVYRSRYYYKTFGFKRTENACYIGSGGDDSVIIAYDCLMDSKNNWEKLVIYAMLHFGDTDTTGCIAGSWYGSMYGFEDIPLQMIKDMEYTKDIEQLGIDFYNKFAK